MSAQIAERVLLEPYCADCKVFGVETTVRREAEVWAAGHDADNHPEVEGEDA